MKLRKPLFKRKLECPHGDDQTTCPRCAVEENDNDDFTSLLQEDLEACVSQLPKPVSTVSKWHAGNLVIAGGYIRSHVIHQPVHDVDLFVPDKQTADVVSKDILGLDSSWSPNICTKGFTLQAKSRPSIQVLYRWPFTHPFELLQQFDFSISQAAVWFDNVSGSAGWRGVCAAPYYGDLASRRLRMVPGKFDENAGAMLVRLLRFASESYFADEHCLAEVFAMCASLAMPEEVNQLVMENRMLTHLQSLPREHFDWDEANRPEKKPKPAPPRSTYETYTGGS